VTNDQYDTFVRIQQAHVLEHCPFVETLRGVPRDEAWFDADPYRGGHRCSAVFTRTLGPQTVAGGGEVRPDGVLRKWEAISGEFTCKEFLFS
jgi:hypothetical protein